MGRKALCTITICLLVISAGRAIGPGFCEEVRQRGLVRVREQPWLRINAGGHTATVQALAFTPDSKRLCSAGLDKFVQVWNLAAVRRNLRRVFLRERVIRWQVARGLRGSIYALASSPGDGLLAVGGYGAMGSLGEILLFDPVDGSLKQVLLAHRQTVCSLAWSDDGNWLASSSTDGHTVLWRRDQWKPITLYKADRETYGQQKAALIARQPKLRPIAIVGNSHLILPVFVGSDSAARPRWKLMRVNLADRKDAVALDTIHHGMVSALAATGTGARLASADLAGNLYLWKLDAAAPSGQSLPLQSKVPVLSLGFAPDGRHLVAGTAAGGQQGNSRLQVWDVAARTLTAQRSLADHVLAVRVSPDGKRLAYSGGRDNQVFCIGGPQTKSFVDAFRAGEKPILLQSTGKRIWRVAFAAKEPFYRVAFGTTARNRGYNDYGDLEKSFDTGQLQLEATAPIKPADWLPADWMHGQWTARPRADGTLQLYRGRVAKGTVTLAPQLPGLHEGRVRCHSWIADRQGKPYAIVVGTDVQNSIYVCRLVEKGPCPILRHFRGHHDFVTSAGVSRDLKYLVSGSADGTIRFWSLKDYGRASEPLGKWGASFAVENNRLVAKAVSPAGPLFRKGLRNGDTIARIGWMAGSEERRETRAAAILAQLAKMPWGTQVVFTYARDGKVQKPFQLLPAWQPLVTLFPATNREWALWTPEGYYVASMNGHRLFGWQLNRGLDTLPLFHRADQFRKRLERPDLMRNLLPAGSLYEAFAVAKLKPRPRPEADLSEQIAVTPVVTILSPKSGQDVALVGNAARVTAKIAVPDGCKLVTTKAYANGVIASRHNLVDTQDVDEGKELTYQWDVSLPSDAQHLIQVVVGTDAETIGFRNVVVNRPGDLQPKTRPKLYVLAVGLDEYGHPDIQPLRYSVADAKAMIDVIRKQASGIYSHEKTALLTGKQVTPDMWRKALEELHKELKETAMPDDLLVLFLAGHGIRAGDGEAEKYYYIGYNARLDDILDAKVYKDCISWDDFRILADVPCRKLAFLDTCHSGAIQPVRGGDLRAAVRTLQEDVVITVTASEGGEMAAEDPKSKHGVFTRCLLEALGGRADRPGDGVVTLDELVSYVKRQVPKVTEELTGGDRGQHPTAAPDDLLPYISLPLTHTRKATTSNAGPGEEAKTALAR